MILTNEKMMDYCTFCPKMCKFSCPASEAEPNETYTPWGKMQVAKLLTERELPLNANLSLASYKCLDCLRCKEYCTHGVDVPSALHQVRVNAVSDYWAPPEVYAFEQKFHQCNNPYGKNLIAEIKKKLPEKFYQKTSDVLYWPSCHTLNFYPEKILAILELFEKLKLQNVSVYLSDIQCCGYPLWALGFEREFEELAEVQYYSLRNCHTILTDGAECTSLLTNIYSQKSFPLVNKVVHLLEFLQPYLEKVDYHVKPQLMGAYVYYDSFFLSRHLGIVDSPRALLEHMTGDKPLELANHGKDVEACGVGGGYEWLFPELAQKMAQKIIAEVEAKKVHKIVTANSSEQAMLASVTKTCQVQDLLSLLNENIVKVRK